MRRFIGITAQCRRHDMRTIIRFPQRPAPRQKSE
jgi:hypothetical protein